MPTIVLTATERLQFDLLPAALRDGWEVREETQTFRDSDARRGMRFAVVRKHCPHLAALLDKAEAAASDEEAAGLLTEDVLAELSDADMAEMVFALGAEELGRLIARGLSGASTAEDVEALAAFSILRHNLLLSTRSAR